MFLLVICEILGLVANVFTDNNKFFPRNGDNLLQSIQMQISKQQKFFLNFLLHF